MNKTLLIGSGTHGKIDNIEWMQPFPDMEKYDSLIIDLNSFPRDYPPTLFTNIGLLKRTTRIFIRDNKEIFCIMSKPFRVPFKKIPLNFSWIPFPQRLRVNPMLLGRTIVLSNKRFVSYMENVEKWENELFWEYTANSSFDSLAVNGTKNSIAATLTINNRGKIHFLPKATKISRSESIDILIDLARKEEPQDYPWLDSIEIPKLTQIGDLWNHVNPKEYRNLFSIDHKKVVKTVQLILEDLSIFTLPNTAAPPPVFGVPNTTTAPPVFGAPSITAPPVFGAPSTTAPPPVFGAPNTTTAPPVFGATTNTTAPCFANTTFSFGSTKK